MIEWATRAYPGGRPVHTADSILALILPEPNTGCWLWMGNRDVFGYGKISFQKKAKMAHRIVYELLRDRIPEGMTIDHLCRVRACVNPAHMEPVSLAENIRRGTSPSANAARRDHCTYGHPLSGDNLQPDKRGIRLCRTCYRRWNRTNYVRMREKQGHIVPAQKSAGTVTASG